MKYKNNIIIVLVILVTFIQCLLLFKIKNNEVKDSLSVISEIKKEPIYIKDIDNLLSDLKSYNIVNRKREDEDWIINIRLNGTKEEILLDLELLDNFIIKSYNIVFNNNKYEVDLELKSREFT